MLSVYIWHTQNKRRRYHDTVQNHTKCRVDKNVRADCGANAGRNTESGKRCHESALFMVSQKNTHVVEYEYKKRENGYSVCGENIRCQRDTDHGAHA